MNLRVGKVTKVHTATGKVSVVYEDEKNASLPLSMLTMNNEYSMPTVGDRVVTCHMENGSSKGFVLGTYYGGGTQPKANSGYRKDFTSGAYATARGGTYRLKASTVNVSGSGASLSLGSNASLVGAEVTIGSAAASENENEEVEPDVYLKITDEEAELKAATGVSIEAESGPVDIRSTAADAELLLDTDCILKATSVSIEADDITLKCSYGEITVEEIMKRLERIEDQLGLPHTI
jgi:phage baseplate assembly protein gpV